MHKDRRLQQVVVSYDPSRPTPIASLIPYARGPIQRFSRFPVLAFDCFKSNVYRVQALKRLAYVHIPRFPSYIRLLEEIEGATQLKEEQRSEAPSVLNMSISHGPRPFSEWEPMNLATRAAAASGLRVVFAVGNDGPGEGTLSPWSVAPWVIGVGAACKDGKKLWESSSVGVLGDELYHPTVVAHGIEVPTLAAFASDLEKKHGADVVWIALGMQPTPGDEVSHVTGTSFAAAQVTRISGYVDRFLEHLQSLLEELVLRDPHGHLNPYSRLLKELHSRGVPYELNQRPAAVKKTLETMAAPMEGYGLHQIGHGFVDDQMAARYLKSFAAHDFVRLFCEEGPERDMNEWLSYNSAPLVESQVIDQIIKSVREESRSYNIAVI